MKPTFLLPLLLTVLFLPATQPLHASPHIKQVQITLSNDSPVTMELKVGDALVTLDAGKSIVLTLPTGTRILANKADATHTAGDLITQISPELNGAMLHVK